MLQLPHFNDNVLKRLRKRRTELKIQTKNNLQEFLKLEPETIKELDLFEGNADKQLDLEECVRAMPRVECSVRAYSLGPNPDDPEGYLIENKKLFASDFIKIEFRVKYLNLDMEDREGYVHTRNYPYLKKHSWHFMLCDGQSGDKIFHLSQKLRFNERKTKAKRGEEEDWKEYDGSIYTTFSQRIGRAGEYHFQVHFLSDSYMGLTSLFPSRSSCTLTIPMTSRSTSTPRRTRTLFRAPPVSRLSLLRRTKASTQMRRRRAKTA